MKPKLAIALLLTASALSPQTSAARDDDRHGHERPRAADLKRCCVPGDRDFPKVGGNLGNQNFSGLRQIQRGQVKRLGAAWVNRIEGGLTTGTNQSTAV